LDLDEVIGRICAWVHRVGRARMSGCGDRKTCKVHDIAPTNLNSRDAIRG
jgi:hypothetical protein